MQRILAMIGCALLALLPLPSAPAAAEDGGHEFDGSVEVLVRSVNRDGSSQKYDEDFDGLDSGVILSSLNANWYGFDSNSIDYLHLAANGLGDPFEATSLSLGRKDTYELTLRHQSQDYRYNLYELVGDLDASTWDASRQTSDVDLKLHATDNIDLFFGFQQIQRNGNSLFVKQVNRDLFQLETPLDQTAKRYFIGGTFRLGRADLLIRHDLRSYDNQFNNSTDGNAGISTTDLASLDMYDWRQSDDGDAGLTTLKISLPLGNRVGLTVGAFGTLLGDDELTSNVSLDAAGTSFRGRCSVTNAVCDPGNPCDTGIPGNLCVADLYGVTDGTSVAGIETDHLLLDADLSVAIADPLDFHLQVRSLEREVTAHHLRDLDGNGQADDTEGIVNDATPGSMTRVDYSLDSITGSIDWAISSQFRVRAGFRTIERDLERSGFEFVPAGTRNTDYDSGDDETIVLGLVVTPAPWVRLSADYEEGDIVQAFDAVAPSERDYLRFRARFTPGSDMQIDLNYSDYDHTNDGVDFRASGNCGAPGADIDSGCWNSRVSGTRYSAFFSHRAGPNLDYWLRWARQETDSSIRFRYDTDIFFNSAENGDSIYDNTSDELAAQVNFSWAGPWRGFVRARVNDSDGSNDILGPTLTNRLMIDQDYSDFEGGMTYTFANKVYVGGRVRVFDYDDVNDRLDYDGEMFSIAAGMTF